MYDFTHGIILKRNEQAKNKNKHRYSKQINCTSQRRGGVGG